MLGHMEKKTKNKLRVPRELSTVFHRPLFSTMRDVLLQAWNSRYQAALPYPRYQAVLL